MTRLTPLSKPLLLAILCCVSPAIVVACGPSTTTAPVNRKTSVTGGTSPAVGALTLTGQFYADETVILSYVSGGQVKTASGTPATDRNTLTLIGLPSGQNSYGIVVSCKDGQEDDGSRFFTVL